MDWQLITTISGIVLGGQSLVELVKWWYTRKVTDRGDVAKVVASENENERAQVSWLEARLAERDKKIDAIYAELRAEQAARLEEMRLRIEEVHHRHEVELQLAEANVRKCHIRGCDKRQPPSDY